MSKGRRVLASVVAGGFLGAAGFLGVTPALADGPNTDPEVVAEIQAEAWPEYSIGDENVDVRAAKHQLHYLGYELANLDNAFDESVVAQVEAFQEDQGLDVTGSLDQDTWDRLTEEAFAGGKAWVPGDEGHVVEMIQRQMNAKYQAHITVDGQYGDGTEQAVAAAQEFHDIDVDGKYGPLTFEAVVKYQDYDTLDEG
ncbi:peptidoglycan-binding protein [Spiractinospora alimapuensis]|uniref:peptidoglycan-binding domain-containing protein n=1 Tax=Spiractinospora alimapuensis TaxID=2820884 RepID=UPI001F390728|nr:peptidoglycan-binding protein [Spiractinospora alimapuensis]QVQ50427.1 peptidoglycan-binding protein [Spiractinospora alimapuensis]